MRRLLAPLSLLAVLAALTGCGGGGDDDKPGRTVTVQAGKALDVIAGDYFFDPETIVVEGGAGEPLEIRLKNDGSLAHNLKVIKDGDEIGGTTTFQGGETKSASVTLDAGTYDMVCTVGNHAELGMTGKLEVR